MEPSEHSDEMTFEDFKEMMRSFPVGTSRIMRYLQEFLETGCSEMEAKRWIAIHIWDFPDRVRNAIIHSFMAEGLRMAALREEAERKGGRHGR